MKRISSVLAAVVFGWIAFAPQSLSVPVYCAAVSTTLNYMALDSSQASACLDSGVGNIGQGTQGMNPDQFLVGPSGGSWTEVTDDYAHGFGQVGNSSTGTWTFDPAAWTDWDEIALGFKFGTGNKPDEWFVFQIASDVSDGIWQFFNVGGRGGGLSHIELYARGRAVSEPGTLALLGLGLAGMGLAMRRRRRR